MQNPLSFHQYMIWNSHHQSKKLKLKEYLDRVGLIFSAYETSFNYHIRVKLSLLIVCTQIEFGDSCNLQPTPY